MIELRLGNVLSIGLAALLFFLVLKYVLNKVGGQAAQVATMF